MKKHLKGTEQFDLITELVEGRGLKLGREPIQMKNRYYIQLDDIIYTWSAEEN